MSSDVVSHTIVLIVDHTQASLTTPTCHSTLITLSPNKHTNSCDCVADSNTQSHTAKTRAFPSCSYSSARSAWKSPAGSRTRSPFACPSQRRRTRAPAPSAPKSACTRRTPTPHAPDPLSTSMRLSRSHRSSGIMRNICFQSTFYSSRPHLSPTRSGYSFSCSFTCA